MRRIPESLIETVRSKSDIVETVSSYIQLDKKGKNYWGLCPFHDDANPSMSVSPDKQIYKCFVCGAGGNVFRFIEDFEKISFVEAVIKQAHNVNVDLGTYETITARPVDERKVKLWKLMEEVKNFTVFQLSVSDGKTAREILEKRGYTSEILAQFEVGVALGNNQIHKFLTSKGYLDEEMLAADIIRLSNYEVQDVFYNRIMFPIKDAFNNIIAFSARAISDDNTIKYINTGESELYTKGKHIYNLNHIKSKRRKVDTLVITEGVTDSFAFTMAGHDDVVSLLGTALTDDQVRLLKGVAADIILAFDGDKAGREAAYKVGLRLINDNFKVRVWYNDTDLDPDDLYRRKGSKPLMEGIEHALDWFDFLISYAIGQYGTASYENKRRIVSFMIPHISKSDALAKDYYIKRLVELTGFSESSLKELMGKKAELEVGKSVDIETRYNYRLTDKILRAELELLRQMTLSVKAMELYRDHLGFLPHDLAHEFAMILIDQYRNKPKVNIADILSLDLSEEMRQFIVEFDERLSVQDFDEAYVMENIDYITKYLKNENIDAKLKELRSKKDFDTQLKLLQMTIDSKREK